MFFWTFFSQLFDLTEILTHFYLQKQIRNSYCSIGTTAFLLCLLVLLAWTGAFLLLISLDRNCAQGCLIFFHAKALQGIGITINYSWVLYYTWVLGWLQRCTAAGRFQHWPGIWGSWWHCLCRHCWTRPPQCSHLWSWQYKICEAFVAPLWIIVPL